MIYVYEDGKLVTKGSGISYVYLDADNNVIAKSVINQEVPGTARTIQGVKDDTFNDLICRCRAENCTYYHQLKVGEQEQDGKDISDYKKVWCIESLKVIKIAQIDARTGALNVQGYEFDGYMFSTTLEDQKNWIALTMAKDMLTYPCPVTTADNQTYSFQSSGQLMSFFATGMVIIQTIYAGGRQLKQAVEACTTKAEIDAIVDPR